MTIRQEEHLGPPRRRHVRGHAGVEPEGRERAARVQRSAAPLRRAPLAARASQTQQEASRRSRGETGCRAARGSAPAPESGGQSASITKPARKNASDARNVDARPEREPLAEEVALAGRSRAGPSARRTRLPGTGDSSIGSLLMGTCHRSVPLAITDSRSGSPRAGRASGASVRAARS